MFGLKYGISCNKPLVTEPKSASTLNSKDLKHARGTVQELRPICRAVLGPAGTIAEALLLPWLISSDMEIDLCYCDLHSLPASVLCKYMQTNVPHSLGSILWEYQTVPYLLLYFQLYLLFVSDRALHCIRWAVISNSP